MEKRLGRGLGSLLGSKSPTEWAAPTKDEPRNEISLADIRPNPFQPRLAFSESGLQELRQSLRVHGLLQPVVLRRAESGYELISGERRCRAARELGWARIPAIVRESVTDELMLELALVENVQRRDLDPIERAKGFQLLADRFGLTQEGIAEKVSLKRSTVANHLRLLDLSETIQNALSAGLISMGHARALLGLPEPADRESLAEEIARDDLSVREVEQRIRELLGRESRPSAAGSVNGTDRSKTDGEAEEVVLEPWAKEMSDTLTRQLGTRVVVRNRPGYQGQIVIDYFGRDELERIYRSIAPKATL